MPPGDFAPRNSQQRSALGAIPGLTSVSPQPSVTWDTSNILTKRLL